MVERLLGECGDVARDVLLEPGGPPEGRGGGGGHTSSLVWGNASSSSLLWGVVSTHCPGHCGVC